MNPAAEGGPRMGLWWCGTAARVRRRGIAPLWGAGGKPQWCLLSTLILHKLTKSCTTHSHIRPRYVICFVQISLCSCFRFYLLIALLQLLSTMFLLSYIFSSSFLCIYHLGLRDFSTSVNFKKQFVSIFFTFTLHIPINSPLLTSQSMYIMSL